VIFVTSLCIFLAALKPQPDTRPTVHKVRSSTIGTRIVKMATASTWSSPLRPVKHTELLGHRGGWRRTEFRGRRRRTCRELGLYQDAPAGELGSSTAESWQGLASVVSPPGSGQVSRGKHGEGGPEGGDDSDMARAGTREDPSRATAAT
jgi:hypothetical protein